jgi:anti-anti-sigma factor
MPAKLIDERSHFEYDVEDGETAIGRMPENAISIAGNAVSRYHAKIRKDGERWLIEDLGSRHGTFVNGKKIEAPTELKDGDKVVLAITRILPSGEYCFTFKTEAAAKGTLATKLRSTIRAVVERKKIETGRAVFERVGELLVVRLTGIFTKPEVDTLKDGLIREMKERPPTTVIDVGGVNSMNSYGLAVLVEVAMKLREGGKELRAFGAQGSIKKLLLMPGEDNPIKLFESQEQAIRGG